MKNEGQETHPAAIAAGRTPKVVVSQAFPVMAYVNVLVLAEDHSRIRSPLFSMTKTAFADGVTLQAGTVYTGDAPAV